MVVEFPQNKETCEGGKEEWRGRRVGSVIRQREANRDSINIKERERGVVG